MMGYVSLRILKDGELRIKKSLLYALGGFIPFLIYFIMIMIPRIITGADKRGLYLSSFFNTTTAIVFVGVSTAFLIVLSENNKIDSRNLMKFFIMVGMIQLVFVVFSYLIPSVQTVLNNFVINYSKNDITAQNVRKTSFRVYGFSGYFFDYMGLISSIIISIAFLKGIAENKVKYVSMAVMMLIIPLLNARTGIILSAFGMITVIFFYFPKLSSKKVTKWCALALVFALMLVLFFLSLPTGMQEWILDGFTSTSNIGEDNKDAGVYGQILGNDFVFPDGLGLLFGVGGRPESFGFFDKTNNYIDSGYVQCIWRFGLIGTILLIAGIASVYIQMYRSKNPMIKNMGLVFAIIVMLYLFKGYIVTVNGANFILISFPAMIIYEKSERRSFYDKFAICNYHNGNIQKI